ncbi:hypothetical protein BDP27DRAFT_1309420 [Rhodocollybia butyracea]|uniref:Uncharacterized protein n=1 Tax=Rhodocollybia butyracea TaxID=206335 RepID=A0A9P5QBK2_9AGAR|nr:hypothetical protein BDP27DRAFT_1309420 [Rhodocollybia butyracea]
MTTYSAFFSSGLLAAPHMYSSRLYNNKHEASPSRLGMGDMLDDTSDIEVDRSTTPTPATVPSDSQSHHALPRLRRRRSSLTVGTSPINCIKSPTRAAGNALQLQRHLFTSPSRSRSGSIDSVLGEELPQLNNIASKSTSLLSRMRSGSVGTTLKPRRGVRRGVPGPTLPPPSLPLPAIPGTPSRVKAFSLAISTSATHALAQRLAADVLTSQSDSLPASPTFSSPRQPLGDLQLHGYGNDQEMRD